MSEHNVLYALVAAVLMLISFEVGRSWGYGEGKESILELLSNYECRGHMVIPGGSVECTTWERRKK